MADNLDFLDDIQAPAEAVEGADSILYGPPKCGKTSTLDDPKLKILVIDLEGGSAVLAGAENTRRLDIPDLARKRNKLQFEVLVDVILAIEQGKLTGYDMYALDSLTQLEAIVKEYVALKYAPNRKREIVGKFGATADWGDLRELLVQTVKRVHSLTKRGKDSIHWVWTAHVAQTKDDVSGQTVATKVQLQGSTTAEVVMSVVDAIFYMMTKSVPGEDGKPPVIERAFLTRQWGVMVAGVRQSKRRKDPLPAVIKDPVWSEIIEQMGYLKRK